MAAPRARPSDPADDRCRSCDAWRGWQSWRRWSLALAASLIGATVTLGVVGGTACTRATEVRVKVDTVESAQAAAGRERAALMSDARQLEKAVALDRTEQAGRWGRIEEALRSIDGRLARLEGGESRRRSP